jgi:putative transposase
MCGWCKKFLTEVSVEYDIYITSIEVLPDHVHLLVSAPPRLSLPEIVRILKSKSARAMFNKFPDLRKHYFGGELWIDGYFARTIGHKISVPDLKKYIKEQRQGMKFR